MPTWNELLQANPEHSHNYAQRWRDIAASGKDIVGEARLIDAMAPRHARILDLGCGTGRIGGYLSQQGHTVVGTDLDAYLIEAARDDYPACTWYVGDMCTDPIPEGDFDLIVCAGNVLTFLPPEGLLPALRHMAAALKPSGRAVIGFGAGRGLAFAQFAQLAQEAGLEIQQRFATWDLQPFGAHSDFMVAILHKA